MISSFFYLVRLEHILVFILYFLKLVGAMQSNDMRPRRTLAPSREASRNMGPTAVPAVDDKRSKDAVPFGNVHTVRESVMQTKNIGSVMKETQDDATITPPSFSGTITKSFNDSFNPFDERIHQPTSIIDYKEKDPMPLTHVEPQVDHLKKVQFSLGENVASPGNMLIMFFQRFFHKLFCITHFTMSFYVATLTFYCETSV